MAPDIPASNVPPAPPSQVGRCDGERSVPAQHHGGGGVHVERGRVGQGGGVQDAHARDAIEQFLGGHAPRPAAGRAARA